jgi:hypothetical protein
VSALLGAGLGPPLYWLARKLTRAQVEDRSSK